MPPEAKPGTDTTPRVRGLQEGMGDGAALPRYNPACAGTTLSPCLYRMSIPIQPRVCGDYEKGYFSEKYGRDTTPRVRGLRSRFVLCQYAIRYNPACAGTTNCVGRARGSGSIQPRVCGDYQSACWAIVSRTDTTPRVRGLHPSPPACPPRTRYNPACAGTTHKVSSHYYM